MFKFFYVLFFISVTVLFAANQDNLDDDLDMVVNMYDKCPNTPDGVCVDKYGCTREIKRVVNFDSSSYEIKDYSIDEMKMIVNIGKECFGYNIEIIGHTDSLSTKEENLQLSKNRALSIKKILLVHDINSTRIKVNWSGESNPISTNITKDGRFKNRRVEVLFK